MAKQKKSKTLKKLEAQIRKYLLSQVKRQKPPKTEKAAISWLKEQDLDEAMGSDNYLRADFMNYDRNMFPKTVVMGGDKTTREQLFQNWASSVGGCPYSAEKAPKQPFCFVPAKNCYAPNRRVLTAVQLAKRVFATRIDPTTQVDDCVLDVMETVGYKVEDINGY